MVEHTLISSNKRVSVEKSVSHYKTSGDLNYAKEIIEGSMRKTLTSKLSRECPPIPHFFFFFFGGNKITTM